MNFFTFRNFHRSTKALLIANNLFQYKGLKLELTGALNAG